ncbi:MBL fold metallo-hydrolase [Nitrosococcus halophilus]|uniref:MBL fold metallo-hydrolase n=1 Tax=Nitrosococcus halophilus TaxID=133539 RepID=UPI000674B9E3|nr:MBL fold metallo-hydrolase [Nitrosococcus halophilus]
MYAYPYKSIALTLLSGWVLLVTPTIVTSGATEKAERDQLRLHVVFNNVPYKTGLETSWGFSCLIEGLAKAVLFDTGGNGNILLSNMQQLGLSADAVEAVVLSHSHGDHTGGLGAFLARNPDVTVYMPQSFPASFQQQVSCGSPLHCPKTMCALLRPCGRCSNHAKNDAL